MYTKKDIEILFLIKKMLYEDKFTIEGVRQKLGKMYRHVEDEIPAKDENLIKKGYSRKSKIQTERDFENAFLNRGVAQLVSALAWGASGRPFKSARPDF